ncbi:hypothetical protein Y032_0048g1660 [Ancylostoma ceylanicum]|uniref:Uncharacterized protein n=1 Tax=Ancylostoma ceylanicum TaxID=53326 RepID=A0A016UBI5_9BILA|nr:hypothetical protein Y032_0048g1660 [Ancylostoma ceylanicum]
MQSRGGTFSTPSLRACSLRISRPDPVAICTRGIRLLENDCVWQFCLDLRECLWENFVCSYDTVSARRLDGSAYISYLWYDPFHLDVSLLFPVEPADPPGDTTAVVIADKVPQWILPELTGYRIWFDRGNLPLTTQPRIWENVNIWRGIIVHI